MTKYVSSGVTSTGVVLTDESMTVESGGMAISTTVNNSRYLTVDDGGAAESTEVNSGGHLWVYEGGTANSAKLNPYGGLFASSGGTVTGIIENGGYVESAYGAVFTFIPNSFSGLVLNSMTATVHSGTTAADTQLNSYGILQVYSSGSAINTTLWDYSSMFVEDGGIANYTTVNENCSMYISGGSVNHTTVNAGYMSVSNGGMINNTILNESGSMFLHSGTADNTTIYSGGMLSAFSGGRVNFTTVDDGGAFYVNSAVVCSTTVNDGGYMGVSDRSKVTGSLTIAGGATVLFTSGSILDFDISGPSAMTPVLVNNLSLIEGIPSYTITISDSQANGTYNLASGADGFKETVTIWNSGSVCGSITVGSTVKIKEQDFTLALDSDTLVLTITGTPSAGGVAGDLNADGRADIIMTITQAGHGAEGATGAWLIQDDQTAVWGDLSQRNPGWVIFGTGKTSAKKTDDVYIKSESNVIGAWTTGDDGKVTGWETIGEFDSETQVLGLGDFNGNGQTDLLLRNTNGAVGCYFTGGETTGWHYFQSLGEEWKITAVGDLNNDGRDDVVLKHDAGFAGSWLTQTDGTMKWADLDTLPGGFEIAGCGDFDGNGTDDVLLRNGNYYGAWLVQNGNAAGWFGIGDLGSIAVEQIMDFNGDGVDDLRIRTESGDLGAQLVMDADTLDWKYYGSVGSEWSTSLAALG